MGKIKYLKGANARFVMTIEGDNYNVFKKTPTLSTMYPSVVKQMGYKGISVNPIVRQQLRQQHINNRDFARHNLRVLNRVARKKLRSKGLKYYYDANHNLVFGKDIPAFYAFNYTGLFKITYKMTKYNRGRNVEERFHNFNLTKRFTNMNDKTLKQLALNDLMKTLSDYDIENIEVLNIDYNSQVPISRWGHQMVANGSLLVPNLLHIEKNPKYKEHKRYTRSIMPNRCFYDLVMIEVEAKMRGSSLFNMIWEDKGKGARPRTILREDRYERLWEDINGMSYKKYKDDDDKDRWAVSLFQMDDFAKRHKLSLYICDVDDNIIVGVVGKKNSPTLFALLDNEHLSLIPKKEVNKRRTLKAKAQKTLIKQMEDKKASGELVVKNEVIWIDGCEKMRYKLEEVIEKTKTYPIKNVKCNGKDGTFYFSGFTMINDTQDFTNYILINGSNKADASYFGDDYCGQSIIGEVCKKFDDKDINKMPLSHMSSYLYDLFTTKAQKNKMPRGWRCEGFGKYEKFYGYYKYTDGSDDFKKWIEIIDGEEAYDMDNMPYEVQQGKATMTKGKEGWKTFDICKCYRSVIQNMSEYYELDFRSVPIKFKKGMKIRKGFYFINTDYNKLFTGSKWYSDKMVLLGLTDGLIDIHSIEYYIRPVKIHRGDYFNKLIKLIKKDFNGNKDKDINIQTQKSAINDLAGLVQRHKRHKKGKHKLTNDIKEVGAFLSGNRDEGRFNEVLKGIYCYGSSSKHKLYTNHLPIANQLLDEASILVYNKVKCLTDDKDAPVYYNTDSITIHEDFLKDDYELYIRDSKTKKFGDLCEEHKYFIKYADTDDNIFTSFEVEDYEPVELDIKDSADWAKYGGFIRDGKSVMTMGDGGTGKSHIIKNLDKCYNLCKVAFTNKACNKIDGKTFHKEFVLKKHKILRNEVIKKTKKNKYDAIVAEEFSMNAGWAWRILDILQKELDLPILAFGDWKQIPPVKDDSDYKNHILVKRLFDYKTTLTKNYRADKKLVDYFNKYATNMKNFPIDELPAEKVIRFKNICWTNKKRKSINAMCAKLFNKDKKAYLTYSTTKDDEEENQYEDDVAYTEDGNPTQNISVAVGTPLICRKTRTIKKDGVEDRVYYNNEEWVITKLSSRSITLEEQVHKDYTAKKIMKALGIKSKHSKNKLIQDFIATKAPKHKNTKEFCVEMKSMERDDRTFTMPLSQLQKTFLIAFCITTHKAQGDTIKCDYNIYEWNKMDNALQYTAMSRSIAFDKVCVFK